MPTSTAKSTPADTVNTPKPNGTKLKAKPQARKTRVIRRRGRARDTVESDDEIEREAATDSDSDDDQHSLSSPSDTDSDTEPASDDVVPVAQSPRVATIVDPTSSRIDVSESLEASSLPNGKQPSFFHSNGDWSEMVNEENEHGSGDLPVIDYADFDGDVARQAPSQPAAPVNKKKLAKKAKAASRAKERAPQASEPEPQPEDAEVAGVESDDAASDSSRPATHGRRLSNDFRRPPGQTARQAYQNRLEADPSFIPTVGEFWGHDDRLMDKGLRSLSGWWRGRWQNRGRGRGGFGPGFGRGRGRGGGYAGSMEQPEAEELPPIEKAWTHDGFEEMKQRELHFAAINARRGGASPRGGRGGFFRGGFVTPPRGGRPFLAPSDRPWHTSKPEKAFTRHHESFLFQEPRGKPFKFGGAPTIRVKLGGEAAKTVPLVTRSVKGIKSTSKTKVKAPADQPYVVRIPPPTKLTPSEPPAPVPVVAEEPLPPPPPQTESAAPPQPEQDDVEEVFKIRPHLVPAPIHLSGHPSVPGKPAVEHETPAPTRSPPPHLAIPATTSSQQEVVQQLEKLALESIQPNSSAAQLEQPALQTDVTDASAGGPVENRPTLHPLQTVFSSQPVQPIQQQQPTPPYNNSPYGYPAPLPHGIAMNAHGVPYEVSTGRPVYFQPPMPIYNPRPLPPPFVPGHMHHHSSAEFYPHQSPSHTPPVNGYVDPTIFSMARSSRVQIRAPDGSAAPSSEARAEKGYSQLNSNASSFEPMPTPSHEDPQMMESGYPSQYYSGHYPSEEQHAMDPAMMGYQGYSQYYYPQEGTYGGDGYGYGHYMDMSQMGQYDMYPHPQDAHTAHGPPVFY